MPEDEPSQDRIDQLISRLDYLERALREQTSRLYYIEQRLGLIYHPSQTQPARPQQQQQPPPAETVRPTAPVPPPPIVTVPPVVDCSARHTAYRFTGSHGDAYAVRRDAARKLQARPGP